MEHGFVSNGWGRLGNVSDCDEEQIREGIKKVYPDESKSGVSYIFKTLRNFYHEVKPGDYIIARRGRKTIAAIGSAASAAY